MPRTIGCSSIRHDVLDDDSEMTVDPWKSNPGFEVIYENFYTWKNIDNGVQFERMGEVRLYNMTLSENGQGGIIT